MNENTDPQATSQVVIDDPKEKVDPVDKSASPSGAEKAETTSVTIDPSSEERKEEVTKEDLDKKALADKVSVVDKRYSSLQKEYESILNNLNPVFQKNKAAYEEFRQNLIAAGGEDPGTHENLYGYSQAPVQQTPQVPQAPQIPQQYPTPNYSAPALTPAEIAQMVDERAEDREGWKEFARKVPELDPNNLETQEEIDAAREKYERISTVASALKVANPRMSSGDALYSAWNSLEENRQKALADAEELGVLQGRQSAYIQGSSISGTSGGRANTGKKTVAMNSSQRATYEKLKAKDPNLARKYAEGVRDL